MTEALWRKSDPITSRLAALSIAPESISDCKGRILELLQKPMTDEQLVEAYDQPVWREIPSQSPSGIRSRRASLAEAGLVVQRGFSKTRSGRQAIVWGLADV